MEYDSLSIFVILLLYVKTVRVYFISRFAFLRLSLLLSFN